MITKQLTDEQLARIIEAVKDLSNLGDNVLIMNARASSGGQLAQKHIDMYTLLGVEEIPLFIDTGLLKLHQRYAWDHIFSLSPVDNVYYMLWWNYSFNRALRRGGQLDYIDGDLRDAAEVPRYQAWRKEFDRKQQLKAEAEKVALATWFRTRPNLSKPPSDAAGAITTFQSTTPGAEDQILKVVLPPGNSEKK